MRPCDDPEGLYLRAARNDLDYEPETGILRWRVNRGRVGIGDAAGTYDPSGRYKILLRGKKFFAHRIAWAIFYGTWPSGVIDHINRNPTDNRIVNLRDVTHSVNQRNRRLNRNSVSGIKGISRMGSGWRVKIGDKYVGFSTHFAGALEMRRAAEIAAGGYITTLSVDLPLIVNE